MTKIFCSNNRINLGDPYLKIKQSIVFSVFFSTASRKRVLLGVPIYPVGGGVRMFAAQLPFVQHEKPSADQPETTIDFFKL